MNTRDKMDKLLTMCPNYEKINTYEFLEDDSVSEVLVNFYVDIIDKLDLSNNEQIQFINDLDNSLSKYVDNYSFRRILKNDVKKISKDEKYYAFKVTSKLIEKASSSNINLIEETIWI